MNLKAKSKQLLWAYQRALWYLQIAYIEIKKPLGSVSEFLGVLTFLAVYGVKFNLYWSALIYILLVLIAIVIGYVVVQLGITAFNTRMNNQQNIELSEVHNWVKKQKDYEPI